MASREMCDQLLQTAVIDHSTLPSPMLLDKVLELHRIIEARLGFSSDSIFHVAVAAELACRISAVSFDRSKLLQTVARQTGRAVTDTYNTSYRRQLGLCKGALQLHFDDSDYTGAILRVHYGDKLCENAQSLFNAVKLHFAALPAQNNHRCNASLFLCAAFCVVASEEKVIG
jgi:hypothetical protein